MNTKGSSTYSPEIVRNVMVVYGFFFVLLAALLSAAIQTMDMNPFPRVVLYIFSWPLALSSAFIGLGLIEMLEKVPDLVAWGFILLASIVLIGFLLTVGILLLHDLGPAVDIASAAFSVILICIGAISATRTYQRYKKRTPRTDVV
jgi:hypothetical protein